MLKPYDTFEFEIAEPKIAEALDLMNDALRMYLETVIESRLMGFNSDAGTLCALFSTIHLVADDVIEDAINRGLFEKYNTDNNKEVKFAKKAIHSYLSSFTNFANNKLLNEFLNFTPYGFTANRLNKLLLKCESPIEVQFVEYLFLEWIFVSSRFKSTRKLVSQLNLHMGKQVSWLFNQVELQYKANEHIHESLNYRLDIAFPRFKLAVELDGHQYHSSKEARSKDAQRDRELLKYGWIVIRFTGSDIYKNSGYCVDECMQMLCNRAIELKIAN